MVCVSGRHGNGHRPDAPINVHALAERLHRRKRTQAAHKQFESSLYYTSRTLLKLSVICSEAIQKALPTLRITRGSVHYLSARHQGHDPHAARCRAARGPPCHVAASFRAQLPEACTRRLARGASELAASLPPLADAPRCSCSLGLLALILLYRRRKSRHAPNEWRLRRSWTAGPPAMPSMMDTSTEDFLRRRMTTARHVPRYCSTGALQITTRSRLARCPLRPPLRPRWASSALAEPQQLARHRPPAAKQEECARVPRRWGGVAGAARQQFIIPVRLRTVLHGGGDWFRFWWKRPKHAHGQR